ncbi:MAG TPA: hypothetical protein VI030_14780 [Propionibacteriaceae bacterium]
MRVLDINAAILHDSAAGLVVDGRTVAAPRDVLEQFGSTPVDALAISPYLARRP